MKAALLSAFVFPGVGHFFLSKHIRGVVLSCTAFAGLYFLIAKSLAQALEIAEKIQSGEVQLDSTTITNLVLDQTAATESHLLNMATAAIVISWLIGIADSYRIGRAGLRNTDSAH